MTQVQNFTEIPKSDYSLGLRNLFIILLVLVSLVLFLSWDKTLTMDALVEGQKDTVTWITLTPRGNKRTNEQYVFLECLTHRLQTDFRIVSSILRGEAYDHSGFLRVLLVPVSRPIGCL
jgi:hypothetical protein